MTKRLIVLACAGLAAGAVLTTGLAYYPGRHKEKITTRVDHNWAVVPAVDDWGVLGPRLVLAIDKAQLAARERAQRELAAWVARVMERVDPAFLDAHLSYVNKRTDDLKWIWRRLREGKQVADRQYLQDVAALLSAKALDPVQLQAELEPIATAMAHEFSRSLASEMAAIRQASGAHTAVFDAQVDHVALTGADRSQKVTLKSLAAYADGAVHLAELVAPRIKRGLEPIEPQLTKTSEATQQVVDVVFAAALAGQTAYSAAVVLGAGKTAAGAVGAAAAGVVVIVAVGGVEWWNHKEHVQEARPQLKKQIERSLTEFTEASVRHDGRFGAGLDAVCAQLVAAIRRQETPWGRLTTRVQAYLSL